MMVTYGVLTVPERKPYLDRLMTSFDAAGIKPIIFTDTDHVGHAKAAENAWQALARHAKRAVLLEDDVILCDRFFDLTQQAIDARPDEIISLFGVQSRIKEAYDRGYVWARAKTIAWNQAVYMPTRFVERVIKVATEFVNPACRWWDVKLSVYALKVTRPIYFTSPCLVQHEQAISTVQNPTLLFGKPRIAALYYQTPPPLDFFDLGEYHIGGGSLSRYKKDLL